MAVGLDGGLVFPAEVGLATHARASGDGQRTGLDVAQQHAAFEQFDARRAFDVAFEFTGNDDFLGAYAAGDLGAGFDGQVALDVDVALELAGDADVAGAFDLAFDGDVGGASRKGGGSGVNEAASFLAVVCGLKIAMCSCPLMRCSWFPLDSRD